MPLEWREHTRVPRAARAWLSSCVCRRSVARGKRPGAEGEESDAPDQFKVELTASACGAAGRELGSGAEPRAYALADGLGLSKGLVACARPARI